MQADQQPNIAFHLATSLRTLIRLLQFSTVSPCYLLYKLKRAFSRQLQEGVEAFHTLTHLNSKPHKLEICKQGEQEFFKRKTQRKSKPVFQFPDPLDAGEPGSILIWLMRYTGDSSCSYHLSLSDLVTLASPPAPLPPRAFTIESNPSARASSKTSPTLILDPRRQRTVGDIVLDRKPTKQGRIIQASACRATQFTRSALLHPTVPQTSIVATSS